MSLDLDHVQQGQLHEALMSAFNRVELKKMLYFKMNANIDEFAASLNLNECIMDVIMWANKHGKLVELVLKALEENGTNPQLMGFAKNNHIITSEYTIELPALDPSFFDNLEAPKQPRVKPRLVKQYREDIFLTQADAKAKGFTGQDQFGILTINPLTVSKADRRIAVRIQIDDRGVDAGTIQVNQHFAQDVGLLHSTDINWSLQPHTASKVQPISEAILEQVVECDDIEREIRDLRQQRTGIFTGRSILVEQNSSISNYSIPVQGRGYFNLRSIKPDLQKVQAGTILTFTEQTRLQLFVPYRKSGVDMIVVVDGSGSMDIPDYIGADSKWHTRLEGILVGLNMLMQRRLVVGSRISRLALIIFGAQPVMLYPTQEEMIEVKDETQIKDISQHLTKNLNTIGMKKLNLDRRYTNISKALSYAADLLAYCYQEGNEKVLVLLSDGADWTENTNVAGYGEVVSATADPAVLADTLHDSQNIRIHTIAISNEKAYRHVDPTLQHPQYIPNTTLLSKVADSTDGIFFESPDAKTLTKLFEEIGQGTIYPL